MAATGKITRIKAHVLALACGCLLAQAAYAGGTSDSAAYHGQQRGSHTGSAAGSIIGIGTPGGTYTLGVSAWRYDRSSQNSTPLAPKAKIIDVKAQLEASPCTYQAGVCIIRP
ncbi:hypothetical protein GOZ78_18445 [Agrobacterium vitis]|uniref:Uncharacterized protein n=1 Tax=Agrobacterium vitis TaxID=373 RepID=A0ABD6GIR4_AGRVI|nr:hypothetical protein [Agrobacterium vitis]MUO79579.1 hypothetical protein [Agrobacterium vitis]MUO95898.1 hypothetical protein [Agrobacterium vitis]MUP06706.1 hypothetical protein [Agrobacterium vitis]MUZ83507.1 hypothetical protein [Agrobacterium vitis]MVA12001.1 hypothetical protein [Agrobacterium vitis]